MSYLKQLTTAFKKLSTANSLDDLIRLAILTLINDLGFDRAGFLLYDSINQEQVGTWGTDKFGTLRTEYSFRAPLTEHHILQPSNQNIRVNPMANFFEDGIAIGHGWNLQSAIFNEQKLIGWLYVDNLLNQKPLTEVEYEVLETFSSVFAQLVGRTAVEATLIDTLNSMTINELTTGNVQQKLPSLDGQLCSSKQMMALAERLSGLIPMSSRSVGNLVNFISLLSTDRFNDVDRPLLESARKSADRLARIFKHFDHRIREVMGDDVKTIRSSVVRDYWLRQFAHLFRNTPHQFEILIDQPETELDLPVLLLTQMVRELVVNTLQHGLNDKNPGITVVRMSETGNRVILTIEDSGIGLDNESYADVLKLFVTSKPNELLGSGLNVTQHFVERWLNGQLELSPSELGGLCCRLTIPNPISVS